MTHNDCCHLEESSPRRRRQLVGCRDHPTTAQLRVRGHLDNHLPAGSELLSEHAAGSRVGVAIRVIQDHHCAAQQIAHPAICKPVQGLAGRCSAVDPRRRHRDQGIQIPHAETPPQPPTPGEQAQQVALDRITALREQLTALRLAELSTYAEHLTRAITAKLEQLDLNVAVNVTVGMAPDGADLRYGTTPLPGDSYSRIDEAIVSAIAETPTPAALPGTALERVER
jgi:hypothetical protein